MKTFLSPTPWMQDWGIALIRLFTGFFLVYHGWEVFESAKMNEYANWEMFKNTGGGRSLVYLGKGSELVGGLLLFLGFLTRIGCLIIIATLLYITFFIGHGRIWYEDQHPFLFVLLAMVFLFTGPGKFSIDRMINNK